MLNMVLQVENEDLLDLEGGWVKCAKIQNSRVVRAWQTTGSEISKRRIAQGGGELVEFGGPRTRRHQKRSR